MTDVNGPRKILKIAMKMKKPGGDRGAIVVRGE
jgi:hypothetical protein